MRQFFIDEERGELIAYDTETKTTRILPCILSEEIAEQPRVFKAIAGEELKAGDPVRIEKKTKRRCGQCGKVGHSKPKCGEYSGPAMKPSPVKTMSKEDLRKKFGLKTRPEDKPGLADMIRRVEAKEITSAKAAEQLGLTVQQWYNAKSAFKRKGTLPKEPKVKAEAGEAERGGDTSEADAAPFFKDLTFEECDKIADEIDGIHDEERIAEIASQYNLTSDELLKLKAKVKEWWLKQP